MRITVRQLKTLIKEAVKESLLEEGDQLPVTWDRSNPDHMLLVGVPSEPDKFAFIGDDGELYVQSEHPNKTVRPANQNEKHMFDRKKEDEERRKEHIKKLSEPSLYDNPPIPDEDRDLADWLGTDEYNKRRGYGDTGIRGYGGGVHGRPRFGGRRG